MKLIFLHAVARGFFRASMIGLLFIAAAVGAQQDSLEVLNFASEEHKALYYRLTQEFRCLQCQNQNLADSAAGLADDLKTQVYQMVQQGKASAEIKSYMVARYGDFILYRPAFKPLTLLLWISPFALLACGLYVVYRFSRTNKTLSKSPATAVSVNGSDTADLQRARDLLEHE